MSSRDGVGKVGLVPQGGGRKPNKASESEEEGLDEPWMDNILEKLREKSRSETTTTMMRWGRAGVKKPSNTCDSEGMDQRSALMSKNLRMHRWELVSGFRTRAQIAGDSTLVINWLGGVWKIFQSG